MPSQKRCSAVAWQVDAGALGSDLPLAQLAAPWFQLRTDHSCACFQAKPSAVVGRQVDAVAVVSAPAEVQRRRVLARPAMDEIKLAVILARQVRPSQKLLLRLLTAMPRTRVSGQSLGVEHKL